MLYISDAKCSICTSGAVGSQLPPNRNQFIFITLPFRYYIADLFVLQCKDHISMKKLLPVLVLICMLSQSSSAQSALQFNAAIPNYVQVGNAMNNALAGTNTITVEAWCYLTAYPFLPTIVGNYGSGMQFLLRVDNNRPAFWVDNGGGFRVTNGATIVPLNTWTHLAGVWNGTTLSVYINGVLDGSISVVGGAFNTTTNPVRIGANLLSEAWTGKLDDVRIWSIARTATEISTAMNGCIPGSMPGLLALYNFEEGSGTLLADITGHGYNGTLTSSPVWTTGLGCITLPVNFVSIHAKRSNENVSLTWKVAGEQDILRYEIERSADGRNFKKAGTVSANGGDSYTWVDDASLPALTCYRVKSVDISGVIKYSGIAKILAVDEQPMITISPNPVQGTGLILQFKNKLAGKYDVRLADVTGRVLLIAEALHTGGNSTQTIQLPFSIGTGVYHLVITDPFKKVAVQNLIIHRGR